MFQSHNKETGCVMVSLSVWFSNITRKHDVSLFDSVTKQRKMVCPYLILSQNKERWCVTVFDSVTWHGKIMCRVFDFSLIQSHNKEICCATVFDSVTLQEQRMCRCIWLSHNKNRGCRCIWLSHKTRREDVPLYLIKSHNKDRGCAAVFD